MTDPIVIQVVVAVAVILGALVGILVVFNPVEVESEEEE